MNPLKLTSVQASLYPAKSFIGRFIVFVRQHRSYLEVAKPISVTETSVSPHDFLEKAETPYITMWMDPEGFLCGRYASNLHLSLEAAISIVESRIYFAKGNSFPLLVDMRGIKSTTKKARQYMATIGTTLTNACALITGSAVNRTLGNIFLTIDKPQMPTRMFTDEHAAKQWLRQYL